MTHPHDHAAFTPRIQTPCPKSWDELTGDGCKRFCAQCSLHVHNGSALTRAEASALVANATERVCMRLEFDPSGAPVFKDTVPAAPRVLPRVSIAARVVRWAGTAAAGVLAACSRTAPPTCETPPLIPGTTHSTAIMGKIAVRPEILGDVALPPPVHTVKLGEATALPAQTPAQGTDTPPAFNKIIQDPNQLPR